MNRWKVPRQPLRYIDVRDGTAIGAQRFGNSCERTVEAVACEHHAFADDHSRCDGCTPIGSPRKTRPEHVHHAQLDREPYQCVDTLDRDEGCPPSAASTTR